MTVPDREDRILIVDDDAQVCGALRRVLERSGRPSTPARDAREARERLEAETFALALCDVSMPGESGLDLVRYIHLKYPDTAAVMVTAMDDVSLAEAAFELGAYGYIVKPFTGNEVLISVANALRRRKLEIENRMYSGTLEKIILERTTLLKETFRQLKEEEGKIRAVSEESIYRLAKALEFRDEETSEHARRLGLYSALLGEKAGLDAEPCERVRLGAVLHDIGKIGTPDGILFKPAKLTAEEFAVVRRHPEIGHAILAGWEGELFATASAIAWTHHERWDGEGYPRGLSGEAIPIEGRIVAVGDVFDALTSERPYRAALPVEQAIEMLKEGRGRHFDPRLLDLFLASMDEMVAIKRRYEDAA